MASMLDAPALAAVQDLLAFVDASPTPYHAVVEVARRLRDAGFQQLNETDAFALAPTETTQKHGDLIYRLFRATAEGGITGGVALFFDVAAVEEIAIAAPELREPNAQKAMASRTPSQPVVITPAIRRAVAAAGRPVPVPKPPIPQGLTAAARRPGVF